MASPRIPHALEMRQLKYGSTEAVERDAVAKALLALDRRAEAVLLYEGRSDHPFLRQQATWASDHGDAFLMLLLRKMGVPTEPSQLRSCAEAAERKGRWLDARQCYVALADEAALVRISPHLPACLAVVPAAPEETE